MVEQVRLCAVWPTEKWFSSNMNHIGLEDCLNMLLSCFRKRMSAARILKAQLHQDNFVDPESQYLSFERLPHTGHSKTYDIDYQTADSASTASAMFSGVKTKYKVGHPLR